MEHIYRPGKDNAPTLILLHGTGGDETDLIPLGTALNPNYNLLSIRGEVNENGMNRYFKRLAEGVYDEEDLEYRGQRLLGFIYEAAEQYQFDLKRTALVGFSNGSNIAINLMLRDKAPFKSITICPTLSIDASTSKDMSDVDVLLSMGKMIQSYLLIKVNMSLTYLNIRVHRLQKYGSIVMKLHKLDYRKVKKY